MDQPSPYTPGEIAQEVPGRATQLDFFRERAQYIAVLGKFAGRIVAYYAPRGVGKTSLLRSAQRIFRANGILQVWVTANEDENLLATILDELRRQLPAGHKALKTITDAIESLDLQAGVSGSHVGVKLVRGAEPSGAKAFQRALLSTVEAITASGENKGIVILIDELQSADKPSLRVIAHAWQELKSAENPPAAGLFGVGLPGMQEYVNSAVTHSERFDFIELPNLDDGGVAEALLAPAAALGVTWDKKAVIRGVEEAQRYAYKVQLIGDQAWKAAGLPGPGSVITEQHVIAGLEEVGRQMRSLYAARWRAASKQQRDILIAIAKLGGKAVKREDVAAQLGKSSRDLSVPRDRLLRAGVIEATDYGLMSFTVPGFTDYVMAVAE